MPAAVGIDLGTTQSVIAHAPPSGRAAVVPSLEGAPTTPSVVLFDRPGHVVVGSAARSALATDPESVVQLVKRRMGQAWEFEQNGVSFRPEHISALILRKVVTGASRSIGPIAEAVVTVPAYFNDAMRFATRTAAVVAGIRPIGLLAEPTAAGVAFGYERQPDGSVGMVVDLGGGTFDISVLEWADGRPLTVRATGGDSYLGGANFDKVLFDHFVAEFRREHDFDLNDPEALSIDELTVVSQDWLSRATTAKHDLSVRDRTTVLLQAAGLTLRLEVARPTFEQMSAVLLDQISEKVLDVLGTSGIRRGDIAAVLSVGGSSRIPAVRARFEDLLGRPLDDSIAPDEAVARGAALWAARLQLEAGDTVDVDRETAAFLEKLNIADVSPHGIGVGTADRDADGGRHDQMTVILPPGSALGSSRRSTFYTARAGETRIVIALLEGDSPLICSRVGQIVIDQLPAGRPAFRPVDVQVGYDADGVLVARAADRDTGRAATTRIQRSAVSGALLADPAARAVREMTVG